MELLKRVLLVYAAMICASAASAASLDPYIGYAYPAGGQKGTTFRITVAGQRLRSATGAFFSGAGIRAAVVGYEGPGGPLSKLQQDELKRRLQEIRMQRLGGQAAGTKPNKKNKPAAGTEPPAKPVKLPDLPELRNLEQQSNAQLIALADKFINPQKRPKPPIAEQVALEITIQGDAAPGDREIRLRTSAGLSNPLVFQVGELSEVRGGGREENLAEVAPVRIPAVLNGQIMPGQVDRFPLQLRGGRRIVAAVQARKLIPYLADAVPGWFQAVVSIRDSSGKELAYADDCGFVPDPVLTFTPPADGDYTLEIRDALYRGREDFVYRIDIGDDQAIRPLFPLGMRGGVPVTTDGPDWRQCEMLAKDHFRLDESVPELKEKEPNNTGQTSIPVSAPCIISGCISAPGDRDVFSVTGKSGDSIVAEVFARRMGSPIDSLVRIIDTSGKVVAANDDQPDPESGLFTHHADSCVSARLPASGKYFVQVSDSQDHGGADYSYWLRLGPPRPDFSLRVTPSSLNLVAGRACVATVFAVRKDGWDGDIRIDVKDAPSGFVIHGGVIPKGRDKARLTITAPRMRIGQPIELRLEGRADIDGKVVTRPCVPADDMMQAFAYHHLVPASALYAAVARGSLYTITEKKANSEKLTIPAGGTAEVSFTVRPAISADKVKLELVAPPAGIALDDVACKGSTFTLTLKADDKSAGCRDNLIVEVFTQLDAKARKGPGAQPQRISAGVLPAIPIEVVKR